MAVLTVITLPGSIDYDGYDATSDTNALTTASDTFVSTGYEFLRLEHTGAPTPDVTVTVTSVADELGRTQNWSKLISSGDVIYAGPFSRYGWASSGAISITASAAGVNCDVVRFPTTHTP